MFAFLNGKVIANNSIVTESEIGTSDKQSLLCYTNFRECCHRSYTKSRMHIGEWYDPMGGKVPHKDESEDRNFKAYRNRGQSVVRLHRTLGNRHLQIGVYQCAIDVTSEIQQSLYIGVYP